MKQYIIKEYKELLPIQKEEIVKVFVEGFRHLLTFAKTEEELWELYLDAFHQTQTLACVDGDQVLGFIGIANKEIRPIKLSKDTCIKVYGNTKGTIIYKQMNAIFQSQVVKEEDELYIDVLATSKEARARGVGTELIKYACNLKGYKKWTIEVLSKNNNAKRLYEKLGFVPYKKLYLSPVTFMGHGYPIKMRLESVTGFKN